jgi:hypothetical protein
MSETEVAKEKKPRKSPNATPDNHTTVKFHLPNELHAKLSQIAEDNDRNVNDYIRVIAKAHANSQGERGGHGTQAPRTGTQAPGTK